MEGRRFGEAASNSHSGHGSAAATRSSPSPRVINYGCEKVQRALEHLASIDMRDLCNEAKVERCRATRDLRNCGRSVESVLNSCGHASLCAECGQRYDICPICRTPLAKNGNRLRLRLYYECIEAGLISKRCDDRIQEKEEADQQVAADIERLYNLFDVAIENNLVSLICHYVKDVCMDESAVSSDPVIAFLLDEVVVKDWCKRMFKNIKAELQRIYDLPIQEMKETLSSLLRFPIKLAGVSGVLEVLESLFKGSLSTQFHDLHEFQDTVLKSKQHVEIMIWCIRHQFLENVRSRHKSHTSWCSTLQERKAAAIQRSWPDSVNYPEESNMKYGSTLFIEDALTNVDTEDGLISDMGEKREISALQKNGRSSFLQSNIQGMAGCYPFENLRAAIDTLFLHGSSDMVVAKQAIFLYYLYDRHWTLPDQKWRYVIDDFAATFGVTRHSLLESFTFYLMDDHTDEALKEACSLLPEISGPTTHPKIAQVLLERQNPDAAFMVLRWTGRDGGTELVSLGEAVTAVRVRVECGLLTEAFMYQRMLCSKLKKKKLRNDSSWNASDLSKDESKAWMNWVEVLVTEICCLCIRRNLVDRIVEFPWNSEEEKHLHKCLIDFAMNDPSTTTGSLLVVFYLQRYRYIEAYQVDLKLQNLEQDFISNNSVNEEVLSNMRLASQWRAGLVGKGIELLPEVQQQQLKSGKLPELVPHASECDPLTTSVLPNGQEPILTSLLVHSSADGSLDFRAENAVPSLNPLFSETPSKVDGPVNSHFDFRKYSSTFDSHASIFDDAKRIPKSLNAITKNFKYNDNTSPMTRSSSVYTTSLKEFNKSSSRTPQNGNHRDELFSLEMEKSKFTNQLQTTSPHSHRVAADAVISPGRSQNLFKDSAKKSHINVSDKYVRSDGPIKNWARAPGDLMDISWSHEEDYPVEDANANDGPRWRSDDTSEEEEQQSHFLNGLLGTAASGNLTRRARRSRFAKI